MSDRDSTAESSRASRVDQAELEGRPDAITWSIHAAPQDGGAGDTGSSSSEDEEDPVRSTAWRRRRLDEEEQSRADREYAIRLARSMARNPADALLPSPPRSPTRAASDLRQEAFAQQTGHRIAKSSKGRPVTVNDIKNRNCWICSDGDADERDGEASKRRWIHPCKCTLVAHEDCLILWIRTRRDQDPRKSITCPQCSQVYDIRERKSHTLSFLEQGNRWLQRFVPYAAGGVAGGGVLLAATAYGCAAIRLWIGKSASERLLGGRWPAHYFLDIPSIPFLLVAWRFRIFDAVTMLLPTFTLTFGMTAMALQTPVMELLLFPWSALRGFRRPWDRRDLRSSRTTAQLQWPPSPSLTLFFLPVVRAAYIMLKLRVTRKVLRPFARRPSESATAATQANTTPAFEAGQRRRTRVHFIVMAEDVPRNAMDDDGYVAVDDNGNPREIPPGAEAVEANRTTYVSVQSICRLIIGALSSPIIANVMGKFLARCSRYNDWMRRFLGMSKIIGRKDIAAPTESGKRTPIANLFATGTLYPDQEAKARSSETSAYPGQNDVESDMLTRYSVLQPDTLLEGLDPVWFRNTLGLGLFIVAKDIVQLSYRYLRLEHARHRKERTKIVDRPFFGGIIEQLELRD